MDVFVKVNPHAVSSMYCKRFILSCSMQIPWNGVYFCFLASDKPDLGLEELGSLNVKSRFQVFEKPQIEESSDKSPICVKRSPSILSKLAK